MRQANGAGSPVIAVPPLLYRRMGLEVGWPFAERDIVPLTDVEA